MSFEHVRAAVFGVGSDIGCACDSGEGGVPPAVRAAADAVISAAKTFVLFHKGKECAHSTSFLGDWNAFRAGASSAFDFDTLTDPKVLRQFEAALVQAGYPNARRLFATASQLPVAFVFERGAVKILQGQSLRIENFRA